MTNKHYIIATIKSWNIERAKELKERKEHDFEVIEDPQKLTVNTIRQINPRYIFFPHWSWKIPREIYENWECVVFHMTDLPFGRGGSPLQNLIERGICETKISAIKVIEELDTGPVYLKSRPLSLSGSACDIFRKASDIIFEEMIPFIINKEPNPDPQVGKPVLFKRRIPEQSNIAKLDSLSKVYDYIRMLDAEGYPLAFLETKFLRIEFSKARMLDQCIQAEAKITLKEKR